MFTADDFAQSGMTFLFPFGRDQLLSHMPKNCAVAELGVYKGRFSRKILRKTRPSSLALVDAWDINVERGHIPNRDQHQKQNFSTLARSLPRKLKLFSPTSRISIHQGLTSERVTDFADTSLDWIYVDADHSYEGALADLTHWQKKIKPGGVILGHDFTNQPSAIEDGFGVIEALKTFTQQENWHFLALTTDYFPSFLLCRSDKPLANKDLAYQIINSIMTRHKSLIRIPVDSAFSVQHARYQRPGNKTGLICDYLK